MTILNSPEVTREFGEAWAAGCQPGDILALHGELGAGKTQLVKGLAKGLGFRGEVTSPTFTLIHEYRGGRLPVYHLDLYRLETVQDALRLGVEEYLPTSDGVTVIEWPERIEELLPAETQHWEVQVASLTERMIRRRNE